MKKEVKKNYVGIIVEAIILFALLYFLILSFIVPEIYVMVEILMGILFITLAYNNYCKDKKSKLSLAYMICGIFILVIALINGK